MTLTGVLTLIYCGALVLLISRTSYQHTSEDSTWTQAVDTFLDLIDRIALNPISFVLAFLLNFVLLYGIFTLNICSIYLAELARSLEHRRTGGRNMNEVELNSFTKKY